jgi:hypothetical protein
MLDVFVGGIPICWWDSIGFVFAACYVHKSRVGRGAFSSLPQSSDSKRLPLQEILRMPFLASPISSGQKTTTSIVRS